jgi:hypothetical protein
MPNLRDPHLRVSIPVPMWLLFERQDLFDFHIFQQTGNKIFVSSDDCVSERSECQLSPMRQGLGGMRQGAGQCPMIFLHHLHLLFITKPLLITETLGSELHRDRSVITKSHLGCAKKTRTKMRGEDKPSNNV